MKRGLPIGLMVLASAWIGTGVASENLYNPVTFDPLVSDIRADSVGDVLTVLVIENSRAESRADSTADRETDIQGGIQDASGTASAGVDYERSFDGSGRTAREGRLTARIAARVVEVLPDGNLRLAGNQLITVNGERQEISLQGIVRPVDIDSTNTVLSTRMADAEIQYVGEGFVDDSQRPGWLTRFLNWIGL